MSFNQLEGFVHYLIFYAGPMGTIVQKSKDMGEQDTRFIMKEERADPSVPVFQMIWVQKTRFGVNVVMCGVPVILVKVTSQ